jgi:hypothetical protein
MNLFKLHNAIKKVCPIHGVSIGKDVTDKTKWQISFKDEATADQRTAAQGIIDAAELSILDDPVTVSSYEFLNRFTQAERIAIRASTDVYVQDFITLVQAAQVVNTSNETMIAGMAYLVTLGLLTSERKDEILK